MKLRFVFAFAIALLLPSAINAKSPAEFVWLSDLHFDPTANPKLVDSLAAAKVEDWGLILASDRSAAMASFTQDSNWPLLQSSLEAVKKTSPNAQFTVVTGDILVHHFREKFDAAASNHDDQSFALFSRQTIRFLASQLRAVLPGKPVLFAIGNNDAECGDYAPQPHSEYLKEDSGAIREMLGGLSNDASISEWSALGSYSVPHPSLKNVQVISLNSIYFSPKYKNTCSTGSPDPAEEEMQWLERKLALAKEHKQKVWLIFHIPPGVDGYGTSHPKDTDAPRKVVFMWKPAYNEKFIKLLTRYHAEVAISLAGHEHMDDFRLIADSLILVAPAISPVVSQNPAFRAVDFRKDGTIVDARTYFLTNLDKVPQGEAPAWSFEYSFDKTWGTQQIDFSSVSKLYRKIAETEESLERWATFYSVSRADVIMQTKQNFSWLFCASGNATEQSYKTCEAQVENSGLSSRMTQ